MEHDIQQCLTEYVEREIEYWDFSGVIRIVKKRQYLLGNQPGIFLCRVWCKEHHVHPFYRCIRHKATYRVCHYAFARQRDACFEC